MHWIVSIHFRPGFDTTSLPLSCVTNCNLGTTKSQGAPPVQSIDRSIDLESTHTHPIDRMPADGWAIVIARARSPEFRIGGDDPRSEGRSRSSNHQLITQPKKPRWPSTLQQQRVSLGWVFHLFPLHDTGARPSRAGAAYWGRRGSSPRRGGGRRVWGRRVLDRRPPRLQQVPPLCERQPLAHTHGLGRGAGRGRTACVRRPWSAGALEAAAGLPPDWTAVGPRF